MKNNRYQFKQKGIALVEFSIVASIFFTLLFAIIEIGRVIFSWHLLNETTRRAARIAVVCQVNNEDIQSIKITSLLNSIGLPDFSINNLEINYLDSTATAITGDLAQAENYNQIEFVEAKIVNYQFQLLLPIATNALSITAPDFSTLLPRESLGVTRNGYTDC